jgi:2-polyprenyl-3-methyl-5-hydroxy-6-metoxy-1,4-benzoquinol methylase
MPTHQFLPFYTYLGLFRIPNNFLPTIGEEPMKPLTIDMQSTNPTTAQTISATEDTLTTRTKATWMSGDFGKIAETYAPGAEEFVKRLRFGHGDRVLDVACGTGNLTIPAARTGATVTGLDIAPNLLEQAERWARREGLTIRLEEGNAEQMPYEDGSFDAVISMFGAMFAPRADATAAELVRVTRSGGRIAMANWTPDGFIGQMFKIVGKHVPPAPGMPSPLMWGNETVVAERLGSEIAHLQCTPRTITFRFPFDPAAMVEAFRAYYGPALRAFDSLDDDGQFALRRDLEQHWSQNNRATNGTTVVDSTYLEVIAVRR